MYDPIEKLIEEIERLRLYMIQIKEGKSFTDPEVVAASQELDVALDKYQEMLMYDKCYIKPPHYVGTYESTKAF